MGQTVLQLDQLTRSVRGASKAREERLTALMNSAAGIDPDTASKMTSDTQQRPYLAAEVEESLLGAYPPAVHQCQDRQAGRALFDRVGQGLQLLHRAH